MNEARKADDDLYYQDLLKNSTEERDCGEDDELEQWSDIEPSQMVDVEIAYTEDDEEEKPQMVGSNCGNETLTKSFECDRCPKNFLYSQSLKVHQQNAHNLNAFKCWACDKVCGSCVRLKKHLWDLHALRTPYKCDYCHQSFTRKVERGDHVRSSHPHARPFACVYCDKCFRNNKTLHSHICATHRVVERTYCALCDFSCAIKSSLLPHLRAKHLDLRPFECGQCESSFRDKTQLKYHKEATHDNKTPHTCELCFKRFSFGNSLRRHVREVHQSLRRFRCEYCANTYKGSNGLRHHLLTRHIFLPPRTPTPTSDQKSAVTAAPGIKLDENEFADDVSTNLVRLEVSSHRTYD